MAFVRTNSLISVDETDTVGDVLKVLLNNRISSVPVVKSDRTCFIGSVDVLDLVAYAANHFREVSTLLFESYHQMEEFANQSISTLINLSDRNGWISVHFQRKLPVLLSLLRERNAHRAYVTDDNNRVVGVITQSRVLNFIFQHLNLCGDKAKVHVDNFVSPSRVVSINMNEFVIKAFLLIWNRGVSGVAVVDDTGHLMGNISASDVKRMQAVPIGNIIKDLYSPLKLFLHLSEHLKGHELAKLSQDELETHYGPVSIPLGSTMEDALHKVFAVDGDKEDKDKKHIYCYHRVYIVDNQRRPIGVLALRDLIDHFSTTPEPQSHPVLPK